MLPSPSVFARLVPVRNEVGTVVFAGSEGNLDRDGKQWWSGPAVTAPASARFGSLGERNRPGGAKPR
jgi:hypothetical protein